MATKRKKLAETPAPASRTNDNEKQAINSAQIALRPSVNAAAVICEYGKPVGGLDVNDLTHALIAAMGDLKTGNMARCENMLLAQAHALQAIFMNFSRRALKQEYQQQLESFFRMAMKAQNQCRMTLETLATIKNPPVVFAKQANIAHGHQQVNNGAPPPAHAENIATQANELLEAQHEQRLDTRAPGTTGSADKAMAPLGEGDRTTKR